MQSQADRIMFKVVVVLFIIIVVGIWFWVGGKNNSGKIKVKDGIYSVSKADCPRLTISNPEGERFEIMVPDDQKCEKDIKEINVENGMIKFNVPAQKQSVETEGSGGNPYF